MTSIATEEVLTNIVISREKNRPLRKNFLDAAKTFSMVYDNTINLNYLPSNISCEKNNAGIVLPISYLTKVKDKHGTENTKYINFIEYEIPDCGKREYDFFDILEDEDNSNDFNNIIYIIDTSEERLYDKDLYFLQFLIIKYGENILKNLMIIHGNCNNICERFDNERYKNATPEQKREFYNERIKSYQVGINNKLREYVKQLRDYKSSGYKDKSSRIDKYIQHILYFQFGEVLLHTKDNMFHVNVNPLEDNETWIYNFFRIILKNKCKKVNFYEKVKDKYAEKKTEEKNLKALQIFTKAIENVSINWDKIIEKHRLRELKSFLVNTIDLTIEMFINKFIKNLSITENMVQARHHITTTLRDVLVQWRDMDEYENRTQWFLKELNIEILTLTAENGDVDLNTTIPS